MSTGEKSEAEKAWLDYRARMTDWCEKAEAHMELAPGIITSIETDPDYIAVIKIHGVIEPLLNEAMRNNISRSFTHSKVKFPAGEAISRSILGMDIARKRAIALEGEMITSATSDFIHAISQVRNKYAHNIKNIPKTAYSIAKELSEKDKHFLKKLFGFDTQMGEIAYALIGRESMASNLGEFISQVMHIVAPPSFPPLGSILGLGREWKPNPAAQSLGDLPRGMLADPKADSSSA